MSLSGVFSLLKCKRCNCFISAIFIFFEVNRKTFFLYLNIVYKYSCEISLIPFHRPLISLLCKILTTPVVTVLGNLDSQ